MAIKTKVTTGLISILTQHTVILAVIDRIGIEAMNIFNTNASEVTVEFYVSEAQTYLVDLITIQPGEEIDVNSIIAQGYKQGQTLLVRADDTGVRCYTTYTQYSGDDV